MSFCSPFPPQKLSSSGCSDILPVLKSPLYEHRRTTQSCASSEDRTAIDLVSSYEVRSALIIVRRIQSSTSVCSSFTSVFSPSTRLHRDSPFIRSTSSCAVYHRLHQRGTTIANLRQLLHSSSPPSTVRVDVAYQQFCSRDLDRQQLVTFRRYASTTYPFQPAISSQSTTSSTSANKLVVRGTFRVLIIYFRFVSSSNC